jgi:hypothetical protein
VEYPHEPTDVEHNKDLQIDELLQSIRSHGRVVSFCLAGCLVMLGFITIFQIKMLRHKPLVWDNYLFTYICWCHFLEF